MRFLGTWRIFELPPTMHLSAADFTARLITLVYISLLSRELDFKTFALLLLAQGLISLPIQFSDGAVNPEAIRCVTSHESNKKIALMIKTKLIISLTLAVVTFMYIQVFDKNVISFFLILLPIIIFQVLNLQFIQQAERKFSYISLTRIISGCSVLFCGLLLLRDSKDLSAYMYLLPYVLSSFVSMAMSLRQGRIPILKDLFTAWNFRDISSILKLTIPTGLVFLLLQFFQYSTLIFHSQSNESDLLEQVGLNLRVWFILAIPIGIFPTVYFSKIFSQNFHIQEIKRRLAFFYTIIVFFSILVMPHLLNILYGYRATQFAHGVSLYLLSIPLFALSNIVTLKLIGENRGFEAVRALGAAIACNLVSQIFFSRSILGVALSWFMANIVLIVILLVIARERNQGRTFLISAAGYGNIGDDFILENQLADVDKETSISIFCGPLTERIQAKREVHFLTSTGWSGRARVLVSLIRSNSVKFAGGGIFAENGNRYYRPYIHLLLVSILLRKRVTLRAIQVDRLDSQVYRQILEYCLGKVDSSSVRDLISYNNLSPAGKNRFTIDDDLVFFKRPSEMNLTPISICINLRTYQDGTNPSESFLNYFASFLNETLQRPSRVVLLSMMENQFESDSEVLERLKAKLSFEAEIVYPMNTVQAIEMIASSERVIAMRLHCIVLAAMFERNVLAIPYAKKVSSFAEAHGITCVYPDNFIEPFKIWWDGNG